MKKLILILFIFIGVAGYSQGLYINDRLLTSYTTYTMDGDTSYNVPTSTSYLVTIQAVYTSLDALDAVIKWQGSNDGTNYLDYGNLDSLALDAATGSNAISIPQWHVDNFRYHRIYVDAGTCSSGTLKLYVNLTTE